MNRFAFTLLFAVSGPLSAAPWLTADPYPTNVAGQAVPTEFVVTISGIAAPVVTPAVSAGTNAVKLHFDLGPLNLSGTRTITAKARNQWGESAASSPFAFTANWAWSVGPIILQRGGRFW